MTQATYDVAIIGAGPGGYTAAIRASQLGMSTVLIERAALGGICLNWGCIPSKALLHAAGFANQAKKAHEFGVETGPIELNIGAAVDRSRRVVGQFTTGIETLLKQNQVQVVKGTASIKERRHLEVQLETQAGNLEIVAENIIIATGGRPRSLPGLEFDGRRILSSTDALSLKRTPSSIVIVGGGPIGTEFGYLYRSFGAEVTIVEALPALLPNEDADVSRQVERSFAAMGIRVLKSAKVDSVRIGPDEVTLDVTPPDGTTTQHTAECVLVGVGFAPNSAGLGLERAGVHTERGWIAIDDQCQTNVPGVWAVGDVTGRLLLAHVAAHQGVNVVERIAGLQPALLNYEHIPHAVYCQPQVGAVGLTEAEAVRRGFDIRTARFPFRANGMAMATDETEGFTKFVVDRASGRVLGIHIVGHHASEMLGEAALTLSSEAAATDIAHAVHAHPSLGEAMQEAALAVSSGAIHFYSRTAHQ